MPLSYRGSACTLSLKWHNSFLPAAKQSCPRPVRVVVGGGQFEICWHILILSVSSPTHNFLRGGNVGSSQCLSRSPNPLLTSALQIHSGVGSSDFFPTVVILLLPLHKKLSILPQVFEQSLFLFLGKTEVTFAIPVPAPVPPCRRRGGEDRPQRLCPLRGVVRERRNK